jgi:hypothetical protein
MNSKKVNVSRKAAKNAKKKMLDIRRLTLRPLRLCVRKAVFTIWSKRMAAQNVQL